MTMRVTLKVTGSVKHVGYRDAVKVIADELHVVGTIQNMKDESVQIVCEGEERVLKEFIKRIWIKEDVAKPYMGKITVDIIEEGEWGQGTGKFKSFYRIFANNTELLQDIGEELSIGRRATVDMTKSQANLETEIGQFRNETSGNFHSL